MSIKFWQKIKKLIEKRERKAWLKLYGFDNACPHCDTWQGNCNGVQGIKPNYPDNDHDAYKCGNCKRWFIMDCRGMMAVNAKDQSSAIYLDGPSVPRDMSQAEFNNEHMLDPSSKETRLD